MNSKNKGFIKIILIVIIALALAKYFFGFDILDFFKQPKVEETIAYVWGVILLVWNDFLLKPVLSLWEWIQSLIS